MADSDQISGKVVIDITEAQNALKQIASTLEQTNVTMQNGFRQMQSQSKESTQQIKADVEKMSGGVVGSIKDMSGQVTGAFSSLSGSLSKIGTLFMGLGAIFAGGALFKGVVDKFVDMNMQAKQMAVTMGMPIPQAQALLESFKRVGIEGESATGMMVRMTRQLKTNEKGFNDNGIATRDAGGNLLSMNEILFNSIDRLKDMQAGTERNLLATTIFGRSVQGMPGLLRMTSAAVDEMKDHLARLGITLDDVSVAKAIKYKEGMHDVEITMDAVKYKIGEALIPILIQLAKFLSDIGPPAIKAFGNAAGAVHDFMTEVTVAASYIRDTFSQLWDQLKIGAQTTFNALKATVQGNFSEAAAAVAAGYAAMKQSSKDWQDQAIRDANAVRFAISSAMPARAGMPTGTGFMGGEVEHPIPPPETGGGAAFVPKEKGGGGGAPGLLEQWKNELEQLKTEQNSFLDFSKEAERQFWQDKLTQCQEGTKEYLAVQREIFTLSKAIDKEAADNHLASLNSQIGAERTNWEQKRALMDQAVAFAATKYGTDSKTYQTELDKKKALDVAYAKYQQDMAAKVVDEKAKLALMDLARQEETVKFEEKMGTISAGTALAQLQALKSQELNIEKNAITQKQVIYKDDEKMQEKLASDLANFKEKKLTEETKAVQASAQQQKAQISSFLAPIESAIQGSVMGIIQGTTTMQKAIQNLCNSILSAFVGAFAKILEGWMANQLQMLIFGKATQTMNAEAQIGSQSGIAYMENVVALIPTVGAIAAPEAAAGITAGEISTAMSMSALDTGAWAIPRAGAAMLHPGEAVLPASKAAGLDRLIEGGGAPAAGDTHVHLNIVAMDGADVQRVLMNNPTALAAAIRNLGRNFVPVG